MANIGFVESPEKLEELALTAAQRFYGEYLGGLSNPTGPTEEEQVYGLMGAFQRFGGALITARLGILADAVEQNTLVLKRLVELAAAANVDRKRR